MAKVNGGDLVVRTLKREGVRQLFALSGGHIDTIFDACIDEGIRIIDTRHEQAAVHMADGWARVTRQPGVAAVTAGPGVVDAVPGVAVAYHGGAPVVLLGGRSSIEGIEQGRLQDMDQAELLRPITKWSKTVFDTRRIPEYVATALRHACSGRPGPVFLEIPVDVISREVDDADARIPERYRTNARPYGDPEAIRQAMLLLASAQRPVIVAGSGVWWSQAGEELLSLAETAGIPVLTRNMARGIVPDDHPLAVGFHPIALMQADALLVVGTRLDFTIGYGRPPLFAENAKVIQVDVEQRDLGKNRELDVGIVGDARAVLSQLVAEAKQRSFAVDPGWPSVVKMTRDAWRSALSEGMNSNASPIHPVRLCREVSSFLDRDAIVISDGGDIAGFTLQVFDANSCPSVVWVGSFGHLGVGIPYAIAAKLAYPDRQVVVMCGDGTFGLNGMEFDTAIRHKTPFVCVISNDGAWGMIKHDQEQRYGCDRVIGCELGVTRYDKVVEALGGYGEFVERPEDVQPALRRAFESGLPACINVATDPTVASGALSDSFIPWPIL